MSNQTSISIAQIKAHRDEIVNIYNEGMNKAEELFYQGNLSQNEFNIAVDRFQRMKTQATEMLGLIMNFRLSELLNTNVDNPAAKIGDATRKLREAIQRMQDFSYFLQVTAEVIRMLASIILALQTRGPIRF